MGSKSPDAPDYTGAAIQQGEASREIARDTTYANRPTQNTPWGTVSWDAGRGIDPATGQPVTNWTQNMTLNGQQQAALDSQMAVQQGRSQLAQGLIGQTNRDLGTPINWDGMPAPSTAPDVPDFYGQQLPQMGNLPDPNQGGSDFDFEGNYGRMQGWASSPQAQNLSPQALQRNLDFGGAGELDAGGGYQDRFGQQQFDRQMSLLQPQMSRATESLEVQLRNQGLNPGDEAYDRAIGDLRDQQGEDLNRLSADSVRFGADMQQREFDREFAARGQTGGFISQSGQFFNQAGQQAFNQNQTANDQIFNQQLQAGQFGNQTRGQQFGELQSLQDVYGQQGEQQFRRQMDLAQYQDQQRQQLMNEQLAYGSQGFGQQMQQATFQNALRQQAIAEEQQRRGTSINEMNALLTGQQVATPQMPNFMGATQAETPQFLQAAGMQGQFNLGAAQNAMSPINALIGAGGAAAGGWAGGIG